MIIGPLMVAAALAVRPPAPGAVTHRGYVQPAVLVSYHPAASEGYHRISPNLRGTVPAVSVTAGGFLSPVVALEGEFLYGATVTRPQRFSYFSVEDYIAGSRDLMLSELVRVRPDGRGRIEIVAGGGYVRATTSERSIVATSIASPSTLNLPDRSYPYNAFSVTGGVDGAVPLAGRVALTPMFRFRWIRRPDATTGESLGIGNYAVQFGVGVRWW
jgi:hypothetical protein